MCNLKRIFQEWKEWWSGDDENSIRNQIFRMIWDAAVFEVIKAARNHTLDPNEKNALPNWAILDFIIKNYFETQVSAIIRLLDQRTDVISLKRLIKDIRNSQQCLTRNNMLYALGLPYNFENSLTNEYTC